jgi:hypothetical protein
MSNLQRLSGNLIGQTNRPGSLVLPSVASSGQVTFNPESLNNILAGQPNARIEVGNQQAELRRITPASSGMAVPLSRVGGYVLNLASRDVYLDSAGKCVEVHDLTTGKRFHPRNIVIQSFVEGLASSGIRAGVEVSNYTNPVSYQPQTPLSSAESPETAILPQLSNAEWYLTPSNMRHTPHLANKGVSDQKIINFANLVEKVFQRHDMPLNRAQIIAITATALQENALESGWTTGGLGAFQHTSARADALQRFMPAYRRQFEGASNLEAQIAFVAHEMFGLPEFSGMRGATYTHAGAPFRNSKSVAEAMNAMRIFEGYGDPGNRYRFARELEQILHQRENTTMPALSV